VHKGSHLFSGPRGVTLEAARQHAFAECSKGCCIHLYTPYTSHIIHSKAWDTTTICKTVLAIAVGLLKLSVRRQNPPVRSAPLKANRVRDKTTQRVASSWYTQGPIEGSQHPQALYLSPDLEVSSTPLYVGWCLAI
jgi:hypothetical protein